MARQTETPASPPAFDPVLQREVAADAVAQERAPADPVPGPRLAAGYVHAVHPDTGLDVVFCPGEALPEWAP